MNFNKIVKIILAIVAIAGVAAAAYLGVKKLTAKKDPAYYDDNDFFECDDDLEIIDVKNEEAPAPKEEAAPEKEEAAE